MGKLFLTTGDYIENAKGMDAIVDAQNKYMGVGGGICGLVLNAAGKKELFDYCENNFNEVMYPSEVRITPGFNLNMDIIHVLAPVYNEQKKPLDMIKKTYINLVNAIKEKGYKKVMICSLGTGTHGYDSVDIAYDVMKILIEFSDNNDVELYFNSMYPIYKDIYLKEYIKLKHIDVDSIDGMNEIELRNFFEKYNLYDINPFDKYEDFIINRKDNELCLSEELIIKQCDLEKNKEYK